MTVVYSTDIKKDNPEYQAALNLKCPLIHRSELLQKLMENYQALAVAGTHGKTTTTALLTWVLECSGQAPSYAIGGVVPQLAANAGLGRGKYFVAEACESDGTFLNYRPYGGIVTNIDFDHMDYYGTEAALLGAFNQFMKQAASPEHLFWCGDDARLEKLQGPGISYGFSPHCRLRASHFKQHGWSISFDAAFNGKVYRQVEVALTGKHNALNALAVFGLALSLGIEESAIRQALRSFGGVLRRCEKKGEAHGIEFFDDYAHHPTELRATLRAIRDAIGERRLVVVYQPHRYTRARDCMGMYGGVFNDADALFVTEIYAAREQPIPEVTHEKIIAEIQKDLKHRCHHVNRQKAAEILAKFLRPHDVCVTLGAGDVSKVSGEILAQFNLKAPAKLKVGVIFGGASVEHEISLISVEHILDSLRPEYYEVDQFAITRQGQWLTGAEPKQKLKQMEMYENLPKMLPEVFNRIAHCDILFPVLHGTLGEDGTIQGFFEMFSKAYVGCDHRSAAISMDKALTKKLLLDAGMPTSPFISFNRYEWQHDQENLCRRIREELRYPLFVKPTHLGSSVGVHKVVDPSGLAPAIEDAFRFDTHLLVENGIDGREIEFSVLGNDEVVTFPPGEICTNGQVYDYAGKYGKNSMKAVAKADLTQPLIAEGMELVKKAYRVIGCCGMARIDTFLDKNNKYWLNEINPIPGFTKISLYPQMCEVNGLKSADLIDRLIILGLQRRRQLDRLELKP